MRNAYFYFKESIIRFDCFVVDDDDDITNKFEQI